jgi:hypothetical protein
MADLNLIPLNRIFLARFFSKIEVSKTNFYRGVPCWEWTAFIHPTGYSLYNATGVGAFGVHRLFYWWFVGPIPEGLVCDHLCRVRHCINPIHIEAVTMKENTARRVVTCKPGPPRNTHCKYGHEITGTNLIIESGRPRCRTCRRKHWATQRSRKRQTTAVTF